MNSWKDHSNYNNHTGAYRFTQLGSKQTKCWHLRCQHAKNYLMILWIHHAHFLLGNMYYAENSPANTNWTKICITNGIIHVNPCMVLQLLRSEIYSIWQIITLLLPCSHQMWKRVIKTLRKLEYTMEKPHEVTLEDFFLIYFFMP